MSLISCSHWGQLLFQSWKSPRIDVYTKSPFVIAGQKLSGTIVVQPVESLVHFSVTLMGSLVSLLNTYCLFISTALLNIHKVRLNTISIRKYNHGKNKEGFLLMCFSELWYMRFNRIKYVEYKKKVQVYSNQARWSDPDQPISFQTEENQVTLDLHIPHTLWLSNHHELSLHLSLENKSIQPPTFGLNNNNPRRQKGSRIKVVKTGSTLGWWQPLISGAKDSLIMTLPLPMNSFSTDGQKELNVSFFLQVFIQKFRDCLVATLPILLLHPMSCTSLPLPASASQLLPRPATMIPYQPNMLSRMKSSLHQWIMDRSPSISSFQTESTVQNVESYASEKVEVALLK
ncbi:hypothetical protein BY458DRAFT_490029 [Sporodiniella umbellata]|nr:hypothetical protein BY458DRAFT_490029 [Sporodiniella umbellata]